MKKLLVAMITGAALAWFFDPANGTQRRDALRNQMGQGPSDRAASPAPAPVTPVTDHAGAPLRSTS